MRSHGPVERWRCRWCRGARRCIIPGSAPWFSIFHASNVEVPAQLLPGYERSIQIFSLSGASAKSRAARAGAAQAPQVSIYVGSPPAGSCVVRRTHGMSQEEVSAGLPQISRFSRRLGAPFEIRRSRHRAHVHQARRQYSMGACHRPRRVGAPGAGRNGARVVSRAPCRIWCWRSRPAAWKSSGRMSSVFSRIASGCKPMLCCSGLALQNS